MRDTNVRGLLGCIDFECLLHTLYSDGPCKSYHVPDDVFCINLADFVECVYGTWKTGMEGGPNTLAEIAVR